VDVPGIQVFLAPDVAKQFGQVVLDAREEDGRRFLFVRPAQARASGVVTGSPASK
jgi:hypothetical protein